MMLFIWTFTATGVVDQVDDGVACIEWESPISGITLTPITYLPPGVREGDLLQLHWGPPYTFQFERVSPSHAMHPVTSAGSGLSTFQSIPLDLEELP